MEAVIYGYSRKQAIEDRFQFNIDDLSLGLTKAAGIKYPVYITLSVKKIINESLRYVANDLNGVLWDILTMLLVTAKKIKNSDNEYRLSFKVSIRWKDNKNKTFTLYAEIGATDFNNPEPAITIMTEDDC